MSNIVDENIFVKYIRKISVNQWAQGLEPIPPSASFIQIVCIHMNGRAASSGKLNASCIPL